MPRQSMISLAANPVIDLAVDLIDPSPLNPRKDFACLDDLAASLARGQLEAIIVRPHPTQAGRFELANGERRWRAARLVKKQTLEAKVRELTDAEMLDIMLGSGATGNVQGLNPLEEGAGYAAAIEVMGLTSRGVADHFRRNYTHVQRRIALLGLPADAQGMVVGGRLLPSTAWLIARIPDPVKRADAAQAILHSELGVMSFDQAKGYIERNVCRSLKGATFATDDKDLVPAAGACSSCPFNTANDRESYGDTSANRCMSPSCFESKVAAHATRLLAAEQAAGKTPLPLEINTVVFPPEGKGLAWNSGHVEFSKRPPEDLLKAEVRNAPTWRELCGDRVTVHVGIDQDGRAVDVVKLEDALTAVPADEVAIFKDEVVRKHGLKMRTTVAPGAGRAPSVVDAERNETALREKAERAAKKRDKKSRAWLDDLVTGLEGVAAAGKPVWVSYTFWSLMFDRMLSSIGDDDVVFICELYGIEWNIAGETTARKALTDFVGTISRERCGALVTAMTLAPWLLAEGPDAAFVTEWHDAFVSGAESIEPETSDEAKPASKISTEESKRLAELVKAYDAGDGMSPQRCASEFKMSIEDVCGALQLDIHVVRNVASQLRQDCEEAFISAGFPKLSAAQNRITKTATGQRVKSFDELAWPEDFRRVLSMLSQKAKTAPPAAAADEE